jgi:type VI secretion system protein ImpM
MNEPVPPAAAIDPGIDEPTNAGPSIDGPASAGPSGADPANTETANIETAIAEPAITSPSFVKPAIGTPVVAAAAPTFAARLVCTALTAAPAGDSSAPPSAVGWYGKLPAAGDFLTRRLPDDFKEPWDRWLSLGMLDAKAALGEQWESIFLSFSVWRFLWNTGQSHQPIWAGILMPGVDRVGRLFPLTVALPLARNTFTRLSSTDLEARLDLLEGLALQVLEDDDIDGFDVALRAVPAIVSRAPLALGVLHEGDDFASWVESLGLARLAGGSACSAFWLRGPVQQRVLRVEHCPPPAASFLALVQFTAGIEEQSA